MQSSSSDTNNNIIIFSRYKYIAGDFFKSIPSGADGYIIKNVILNRDESADYIKELPMAYNMLNLNS